MKQNEMANREDINLKRKKNPNSRKMAAKSKKRLSKINIRLLKLEDLDLNDVLCSICQSILVEPVTLPCLHNFCLNCFNGSVENNALCCPLCRLRIGSWLRKATKQKTLVNEQLWKLIQSKYSNEIAIKAKGEDLDLPKDKSLSRLSAPGEIKSEYEAELKRLRQQRLQLEEKHIEETKILIQKIQKEEQEAHKKYLEALKEDEILAQQMQNELAKCADLHPSTKRRVTFKSTRLRLKDTKIDSYLSKTKQTIPPPPSLNDNPLLTDDNTSTDSSTTRNSTVKAVNGGSPEMVPSYNKIIKTIIDKKNKLLPGLWNKENGERPKEKKEDSKISTDTEDNMNKVKHKNGIPSLLVSLPLPCSGILQQKANLLENRKGADSVDSMRQELCYFKPIDEVTPTRNSLKGLPIRVPVIRTSQQSATPPCVSTPSREDYLDSLCSLRQISLANKLPSAFVIAIDILKVQKKRSPTKCEVKTLSNQRTPAKCETRLSSKDKKRKSTSPCVVPSVPTRKNPNRNKQIIQVDGISKLNNKKSNLRRTRSMGSISKDENETTPKKAKVSQRKAASDRKPYLRSGTKKYSKQEVESPALGPETTNNNETNLAVKNLSSPFKNCDVKHILHEQLAIEKMIEQQKIDYELALKVEAEWNGRRTRRATAVKRQVTLNYALKPAKKLKV